MPRYRIDEDIRAALNGLQTVFNVDRPNVERRMVAFAQGGELERKLPGGPGSINIPQYAQDRISGRIGDRFRSHDLARLVAGLLEAQGYKVVQSPEGPDGGVDIIAVRGTMGFDPPRLAVQVKSSENPVDVKVLREHQGVMPEFGAEQGLIVSWSGFKDSVLKESRKLFFRIKLWDAGDLVAALQENYENLPADLQAELPLKRVWILVEEEE